jgi:hypothetical protein
MLLLDDAVFVFIFTAQFYDFFGLELLSIILSNLLYFSHFTFNYTRKKKEGEHDARVFADQGDYQQKVDKGAAAAWKLGRDKPESHPYYEKFKARIGLINKAHPSKDDAVSGDDGLSIWTNVLTTITNTNAEVPRNADGWAVYNDKAFAPLMSGLDEVVGKLSSFASAQFTKARSFGFWSTWEGYKMAEARSDLTLETSGIAALFDGLDSLIGIKGVMDPVLFGALSRGYAEMVAKEMADKKKTIGVYAGGGVNTGTANIWSVIESKALESGIKGVGREMEKCVTYYSVARKTQNDGTGAGDKTVNEPGLPPGVWAMGTDRNAVLAEGNRRFALLPKE